MKKSKSNKPKFSTTFISFALVIGLSISGVASAYWKDDIGMSTGVSTGNIDPIFSNFDTNTSANTVILPNRKAVRIYIDEIYPKETFEFDYTISNNGTVPVRVKPEVISWSSSKDIKIQNQLKQKTLQGYGGTADGKLRIYVMNSASEGNHEIELMMQFEQKVP